MTSHRFSVGSTAIATCERIGQQMRFAANAAGLQSTQGHFLSGLALVQRVPELVSLYRSPAFMLAIESMLGARILPNPNLDIGVQAHLLSTKHRIPRSRGVDGFTAWLFCDNVPIRHEGALVIYNGDAQESCRIQPRPGTIVCGDFSDIEHEIEAPLKAGVCARLTYVDALKVAQKTIWGATPTEVRKVLASK